MSILVVGSVAFDTLKTPYGVREKIIGGSATYFSMSASYFTQVRVVAVVGEDFTAENENVLKARGIDTRGLERAKGLTFHWGGEYGENVNEAKTKFTDLNVFENFNPQIPKEYADSDYLFLANIQPALQSQVRDKMPNVKLVGGDTMNLWIDIKRAELQETLKRVDILLINDGEAKMLADDHSLPRAARKVLDMGPRAVVIKHGEYGATIFFREGAFGLEAQHPFRAPSLPIEEVFDPTGAGDCFAGGFMGYLASQAEITPLVLKRAMFYGGVMGSFAVERFGPERLQSLTRDEIDKRFELFRSLTHLH
jgi:sugar/nucleoside kinase (ribokinase family)